jgi:hypothetical protein
VLGTLWFALDEQGLRSSRFSCPLWVSPNIGFRAFFAGGQLQCVVSKSLITLEQQRCRG